MKHCLICHGPYQKGASGPSSIFKKIVEICKEHLLSDLTKEWLSTCDSGLQKQLPFCISCFKSAQNLTELHEELVRIQKGFLNSVVIFTLGIVESRKKNIYNKKESSPNNRISGETIEEIIEFTDAEIAEFPIDIKEEHFTDDWGDELVENDPLAINVSDNNEMEQSTVTTTTRSRRHKRIKSMITKNVQKNPTVVLEKLKMRPAKFKSTSVVCSEKTADAKNKQPHGRKNKSAVHSPAYVEVNSQPIVVDCFSDFDSNSVPDTTELDVDATFEEGQITFGSQNIGKTQTELQKSPLDQKSVKDKKFCKQSSSIYKCDVDNCEYVSRHLKNFKVHQQMRHGEPKIFPCLQCKKTFIMAQSLRSHNVKKHGYKVGPPRKKRTKTSENYKANS